MADHVLGCDLDVGFGADEAGRSAGRSFVRMDLHPIRRTDVVPRRVDLGVVEGRPNLVQAIMLRLLTEQGELAELGAPSYGSRHHQLIGEPNTPSNRARLKVHVLECLRQEPRIRQIVALDVRPAAGALGREQVEVTVTVTAKNDPDPLSFVVPFSFGGGTP